MKKFQKALCFGSLALLTCSATIITLASTGVFKPASGDNAGTFWNHYTTTLPDGEGTSNYGVREYWCKCSGDHEHVLSRDEIPDTNATIVERGPASKLEVTDPSDDRYIAPVAKSSYYVYQSSDDTFVRADDNKTSPGPGHLVRYKTNGNLGKKSSDLYDSSSVTSTVPGEGGYKPYTDPYTKKVTPSLDMGDFSTGSVSLHEYIYTNEAATEDPNAEKPPLIFGIASTAYHKSDHTKPVTIKDVIEIRLNGYALSSCPVPAYELKPLGEDIFCNYQLGAFTLANKVDDLYNRLTIRRINNPDIGGKIRIAWLTSTDSKWVSGKDKKCSAVTRMSTGEAYRPSTLILPSDYGGNDFTKGYVNVPITDKVTPTGTAKITSGAIDNIGKANDGGKFCINVPGSNVAWCNFGIWASRGVNWTTTGSSCSFLTYDKYKSSGEKDTTQTGAFSFTNTSYSTEVGYNKPVGEFAVGGTYFFTPANFKTEYSLVMFTMPLKPGNNILQLNRNSNATTTGEQFRIGQIEVFSNNVPIQIGDKPAA